MFNDDVAADFYEEISKLDDDTAEGMLRCVLFDVYTDELAKNARTLQGQTQRVHKAIFDTVAKSLEGQDGDEVLATASLVSLISKDWDTPYEQHYHRPQTRDGSGRWAKTTITISRDKSKRKGERSAGRLHADNGRKGDFDLTGALGSTGGRTSRFAEEWHRQGDHDATTNAGTYRRVAAGAEAVSGLGGPKTQAVTQTARFLGQYGPEAEKVVGPAVRRAAYRYRGTERRPDPDLIAMQRDQVVAVTRDQNLRPEQVGVPERFDASTKAAISYLSTRLPSKGLSSLQQQSGKIPPSEGIMLNADGKIITQAVGYSDDHYLPFNLKNLKGLQGGSYIRSRSSGGLTTEDIYTGLVGGARQVTVVSRSGVFTIKFDDSFRGGRRYNDKARQMVGRYAQLLDAVQSKKVSRAGVSPEQRAQIRSEVEDEIGDFSTRAEIEDEFDRRVKDYRTSNVPTKAEIDTIKRKALEAASTGGNIKTGSVAGRDVGERQENLQNSVGDRYKRYYSEMIDDLMETKAARQYQLDGEGYAAAMDALREQFPYYIDRVEYVHRRNVQDVNLRSKLSAETDKGYVKPRYIRPEGAKDGFFDESVNGRGKISADRMNYANWKNNPENKHTKPESVKVGEGVAKPLGEKQQLAEAVRRAKAHKDEDAVLKKLVHNYASAASASEYPALASAKGATDEQLTALLTGSKRAELEKELRSIHQAASSNADYANEHAAGEQLFRSYEAAKQISGGTPYSTETLGRSPAIPFTFEGNAYMAGAPKQSYISEAAKQIKTNALPESFASANDETLRDWANFYGTLAKHAQSKSLDSDELLTDMAAVLPPNTPTDMLGQVIRTARSRSAETVAREFGAKAEAVERLRRVKSMESEALHNSAKRQTVYDSGAAKPLTGHTHSKSELSAQFEKNAELLESKEHYDQANTHQQMADALRIGDPTAVQAAFDQLDKVTRDTYREHIHRAGFDV